MYAALFGLPAVQAKLDCSGCADAQHQHKQLGVCATYGRAERPPLDPPKGRLF